MMLEELNDTKPNSFLNTAGFISFPITKQQLQASGKGILVYLEIAPNFFLVYKGKY